MALTKVLITVKTYPTLSIKHDELVCTAGFREDGSWVRIYPVPFRKLDYVNRYSKWQWIEIDLTKNTSDFRPESFRPTDLDKEILMLDKIGTHRDWGIRKEFVEDKIWVSMSDLISVAKDSNIGTSLGVLRPKEIIDFIWEPSQREWNNDTLNAIYSKLSQGNLFDLEGTKQIFKVVKKLPYKFSYIFTTQDGIKRTMMIEDWELGALYWNCLKTAHGDEIEACKKVKQKYFDDMARSCDLLFFVGTTMKWHNVSSNPFIIIGAFYPPKYNTQQLTLF